MSLAIKYETLEDANLRLRHTVVLYKGDPVYVTELGLGDGKDDIIRVKIRELPLDKKDAVQDPFERARLIGAVKEGEKRKFISSKHFDIAPFKLGFVNTPDGAFYCSRLPNRVQRQGLCGENFVGKYVGKEGPQGVGFQQFLQAKGVVDMVHGRYPSFDQAVRELEFGATCVAFHREFALVRDAALPKLIYLYHKENKVGMFVGEEITLGETFRCLREALEETQIDQRIGVC